MAVATTATVAAYSLAGDGSSPPLGESAGTQEPAAQDDKLPTFDPRLDSIIAYTVYDGKGNMSVTNPKLHGDLEPTLGDPKDPGVPSGSSPSKQPIDGPKVERNAPDIEPLQGHDIAVGEPNPEFALVLELAKLDLADMLGLADTDPIRLATIGKVNWGNTSLGNPKPGMMYAEVIVPGFKMLLEADGAFYMYHTSREEAVFVDARNSPVLDVEPGEVVAVTPPPEEDHEDADDQAVRVDPSTGLLIDPLLATGAEVKVTGEVVSKGIFSVDGSVFEVNGETVQVMNYGDAAALEDEATRISPDGSSVGTTMVMWVGSPHFFRTESLIALYVGESASVLEALTKVLGP